MEAALWLGLAFAVGTALTTNLAFLWKQRGAVAAPSVDVRQPVSSAAQLFRSKWWTIGWMVAIVGWAFHVGALALLPLSLAQAVIAGGFVALAVLADRAFGFSLGRRQWLGVGLVAIGLAFLGATTEAELERTRYSLAGIIAVQGGLLIVGLLLVLLTRTVTVRRHGAQEDPLTEDRPRDQEHPVTGGPPQAPVSAHGRQPRRSPLAGVLLATAAGLAFGISDISIKALAEAALDDALALVSPWTGTALLASVGAFFASARSLQIGEGIAVITATSAAANLSTITGGILVFGEALGEGPLEIVLRSVAFLLVVAGAGLVPGPTRAAEASVEIEREEHAPERAAAHNA